MMVAVSGLGMLRGMHMCASATPREVMGVLVVCVMRMGMPASACLMTPMICSSLNLLFFIAVILHSDGLPGIWIGTADGKQVMLNKHRVDNIQGTVCLSEVGVHQAHGTLAPQEVAMRFDWFGKCVSSIRFYKLASDFNAQFIIDGVTQVRSTLKRRIAELRQQLIDAGLPAEKVPEVVGKQAISLEKASESSAPAAPNLSGQSSKKTRQLGRV